MNREFTGYLIAGIALVAAGVPLVRGWIPPNRWAGFRVPKTLSDDRIWYEANRVAGRDLIIAGAFVMIVAVGASFLTRQTPPQTHGYPLRKINEVVCLGALLIAALHSFLALRRM